MDGRQQWQVPDSSGGMVCSTDNGRRASRTGHGRHVSGATCSSNTMLQGGARARPCDPSRRTLIGKDRRPKGSCSAFIGRQCTRMWRSTVTVVHGDCQKTTNRRVPRALLVPLPIVEEPFQRIAMDIVGPLPRSRSGNRYVLVLCDYATRYPEAVPLRSIDAEYIAEEIVRVFAMAE